MRKVAIILFFISLFISPCAWAEQVYGTIVINRSGNGEIIDVYKLPNNEVYVGNGYINFNAQFNIGGSPTGINMYVVLGIANTKVIELYGDSAHDVWNQWIEYHRDTDGGDYEDAFNKSLGSPRP